MSRAESTAGNRNVMETVPGIVPGTSFGGAAGATLGWAGEPFEIAGVLISPVAEDTGGGTSEMLPSLFGAVAVPVTNARASSFNLPVRNASLIVRRFFSQQSMP